MYVHADARGHVWVENSCVVPSLYVGAGDKIRYSGVHGHVLVENSCKPSFYVGAGDQVRHSGAHGHVWVEKSCMTSLYVGAGDQVRYLPLHDKHSAWVVKSWAGPTFDCFSVKSLFF